MSESAIRAAAEGGDLERAARGALDLYRDELFGYLIAVTRDGTKAEDAFSLFLEDLWRGLPRFRWECSFRTWAYKLARHALTRLSRGERRTVPLDMLEDIAAETRTRTASFLRSDVRDRFAELRAALDPDDQTLLILRLNRELAWRDIARVLDPEATTDDAIGKRSAALRKRFERIKDEIRAQLL